MIKSNYQKLKGFTLVEMLLVIAIVGILAGSVYAMIGDSDDANTKSALSTAKSIMPYAQECMFRGSDLNTPTARVGASMVEGGNLLCPNSETNWPDIGTDACTYGARTATTWIVTCASLTPAVTISCDAGDGDCSL